MSFLLDPHLREMTLDFARIGLQLVKLLEILSGKKIAGADTQASGRAECVQNIQASLQFMIEEGIGQATLPPDGIYISLM